MNRQTKAYMYALMAVLSWSTVATAFKIALGFVDYYNLLLFSVSVSILIFGIIIITSRAERAAFLEIKKNEFFRLTAIGLLNPFIYYILLFRAYSLLPAQEALTLNYTWAVLIAILSVPILKQKLKPGSLVALLISFSGVVFLATHGHPFSLNFANPAGTAMALASSVIWALYWLLSLKTPGSPAVKLFIQFSVALVVIVIWGITTGQSIAWDIFNNPKALAAIGYVATFEMGLTFLIWLKSISLTVSTAKISNLVYLSPFISIILIILILGEKLESYTIIGFILIMTGIALQNRFTKR